MTTRYGRKQESGSMFLALFGAVAMLGLASAGLNMMMRGPLTTMANVNKKTVSENSMVAAARLAVVMAPTAQGNAGDCDSDGYVEPVPYRDAGAGAKPSGGGYIPTTLGAQTADAWKTEMGYCAWDPGALSVSDNVAACGGSSAKRLKGAPNNSQYAVAVISAGPDKTFQTGCNAYADANADGRPDTPLVSTTGGADDMVMGYTYAEATKVGGGGEMWTIKSGAPGTAAIGKNIEVSGSATLSGSLTLGGGLVLPGDPGNNSITGACNASNDQKLRRNTSINPPFLEICNFAGGGNSWEKVKVLDAAKYVSYGPCNTLGETRIGRQCYYDDNVGDYIPINCDETPPDDPNMPPGQPYEVYDAGWTGVVCNGTAWTPIFDYFANGEIRNSYGRAAQNVTTYGVTDKEYVDKVIKDTGLPTCGLNEWAIKTETGFGCFCGNPTGAAGWSQRLIAGERNWSDIASSADSMRLIASYRSENGANVGNILISTDGGRSWVLRVPMTGIRSWSSVASSSDGLKLSIANSYGYIYTSVDGGATWTERTSTGQMGWSSITSSADGTKLAATNGSGYIYTSADGGATWTQRTASGNRYWYDIASSSDGTKLAAVGHNAQIYVSTDSGASWTARATSGVWRAIVSSSDGTKLAAALDSGNIYTSTDSGTTWTARPASGTRGWTSLHSSADGTKLTATASASFIVRSADSGATWAQETGAGNRYWASVTGSSDGTKLAAIGDSYIHTLGAGCALASCTGPGGTSVANGGGMAAYLTPGVPYGEACTSETRLCSNGALGGSMENAACAGGFVKLGGGTGHACGVTSKGQIWCWGSNSAGQLGDGTTTNSSIPTSVSGAYNFGEIGRGLNHTCAIASGVTYCWGSNSNGELGDGTTTNKSTPTPVSGAYIFKSLALGKSHSCALSINGSAYCWGANGSGQLGDNATAAKLVPTAVSGGHIFKSLSAGSNHTCGIKNDGTMYCWGANGSGQLGDGTIIGKLVPTLVTGGHLYTALATSDTTTCGIKNNGAAYCWGSNVNGEVGDNTTLEKTVPTLTSGGHVFLDITGKSSHFCALKNDGTAWCWGQNQRGQIGDNTTVGKLVPTVVSGGHFFTAISASANATYAIKSSGQTFSWGSNSAGKLGDGTTTDRLVPTPIYQP